MAGDNDDGDDVDPGTRDEYESRIDGWVRYGMGMVIRQQGHHLQIPIVDQLDQILPALIATIRVAEELPLENPDRSMGTLYQRAAEFIFRKEGFDLTDVPLCHLPGVQFYAEPQSIGPALRRLDRRFVAGVSDDAWAAIDLGDDGDDMDAEAFDDGCVVDSSGIVWRFYRDDGLFIVPDHMEWIDGADQYEMLPGATEGEYSLDHESPVRFGIKLAQLAFGYGRGARTWSRFGEWLSDHSAIGEYVESLGIVPFTMTYDADRDILTWEGDPQRVRPTYHGRQRARFPRHPIGPEE